MFTVHQPCHDHLTCPHLPSHVTNSLHHLTLPHLTAPQHATSALSHPHSLYGLIASSFCSYYLIFITSFLCLHFLYLLILIFSSPSCLSSSLPHAFSLLIISRIFIAFFFLIASFLFSSHSVCFCFASLPHFFLLVISLSPPYPFPHSIVRNMRLQRCQHSLCNFIPLISRSLIILPSYPHVFNILLFMLVSLRLTSTRPFSSHH